MKQITSAVAVLSIAFIPQLAIGQDETPKPMCERMENGQMNCCERGEDGEMHCRMMEHQGTGQQGAGHQPMDHKGTEGSSHQGMDHSAMSHADMDHSKMDHSNMGHSTDTNETASEGADDTAAPTTDHEAHEGHGS